MYWVWIWFQQKLQKTAFTSENEHSGKFLTWNSWRPLSFSINFIFQWKMLLYVEDPFPSNRNAICWPQIDTISSVQDDDEPKSTTMNSFFLFSFFLWHNINFAPTSTRVPPRHFWCPSFAITVEFWVPVFKFILQRDRDWDLSICVLLAALIKSQGGVVGPMERNGGAQEMWFLSRDTANDIWTKAVAVQESMWNMLNLDLLSLWRPPPLP